MSSTNTVTEGYSIQTMTLSIKWRVKGNNVAIILRQMDLSSHSPRLPPPWATQSCINILLLDIAFKNHLMLST